MRVIEVCLMVLAISGCESPDDKARKLVARMVATPSDWNRQEHKRTVSEAKDEFLQLGPAALPAIIDGLGDDNDLSVMLRARKDIYFGCFKQ